MPRWFPVSCILSVINAFIIDTIVSIHRVEDAQQCTMCPRPWSARICGTTIVFLFSAGIVEAVLTPITTTRWGQHLLTIAIVSLLCFVFTRYNPFRWRAEALSLNLSAMPGGPVRPVHHAWPAPSRFYLSIVRSWGWRDGYWTVARRQANRTHLAQ